MDVGNLIGTVAGKRVLMLDDMISTGGTICEAARLLMDKGAKDVYAAATHGVLAGRAMEKIAESPISQVVISDTIPAGDRCEPIRHKLTVLSVGELLGEAIGRIHNNSSISALFHGMAGVKR